MPKKTTSRMRVFFAELEGDDETMQDGLRAIAAAVNKTFEPRKVIVKQTPELLEEYGDDEVDEEADDFLEAEVVPRKPNGSGKGRKPAKVPTMQLVKDLNLSPDGKPSLRSFFAEKEPKQQWAKATVFIYYMKKVLELEKVTANHVYTCFDEVNQRKPTNTPQTIRTLATRQGHVESGSCEDIRITVRGINYVENDLPSASAE